ncbi:hypothetical protein BCR37DRAFT_399994 [Protomyces lactucae-debilis]|uniref:Uncharacterized protein n=1 Tax=Protomyces lactucae-debilis TaxID=2754530 RepID=A0A1Y2F525_PROLT|nr:uncharacterized protein BCR37DRAFT_399994 [Protomyces lactucae-debilis]ORY78982.1 hypothetical protein BCR37DRAFT_399994 [Protomyces lactucae-debilis]
MLPCIDQRGNPVSGKQRDHAEPRKSVRHLQRDSSSPARAQANWISMVIFQHGAKNLQVAQSRHNKRLAQAEAEHQETDDENDLQTRQGPRTLRHIAPGREEDEDIQARQGPRTTRNIASRHDKDGDSDAEAPRPRRTGKRDRPMTAKAQLLQAAANNRKLRAFTASEVEPARDRSKRARHLSRQL